MTTELHWPVWRGRWENHEKRDREDIGVADFGGCSGRRRILPAEEQGERRSIQDGEGVPGGDSGDGHRDGNGERGDDRAGGNPGFGDHQADLRGFQFPGQKGSTAGADRSGAFRGEGRTDPRQFEGRRSQRGKGGGCAAGRRTDAGAKSDPLCPKFHRPKRSGYGGDQPGLGAGPAQSGEGAGGTAERGPEAGGDQSELHPHPFTGGRDRHFPECGHRTDGGCELPDADPLQHRPGSDPHADRYERGRGRHR